MADFYGGVCDDSLLQSDATSASDIHDHEQDDPFADSKLGNTESSVEEDTSTTEYDDDEEHEVVVDFDGALLSPDYEDSEEEENQKDAGLDNSEEDLSVQHQVSQTEDGSPDEVGSVAQSEEDELPSFGNSSDESDVAEEDSGDDDDHVESIEYAESEDLERERGSSRNLASDRDANAARIRAKRKASSRKD